MPHPIRVAALVALVLTAQVARAQYIFPEPPAAAPDGVVPTPAPDYQGLSVDQYAPPATTLPDDADDE